METKDYLKLLVEDIDISQKPVVIDQHHCLHCGRCAEVCPRQTIEKRNFA